MSEPYIGEIRMVGFNFPPSGWSLCDGSLIAIAQNYALFNLIGTLYGGDGVNTFALPDLRGRLAFHQGNGGGNSTVIGQTQGIEAVTLLTGQIAPHNHAVHAQTAAGNLPSPANAVWAKSALEQFSTAAPSTQMAASLQTAGGDQSHDNMPPFLVVNFVISLFGVYPSQD